jgi:hypothetical protein
MQLLGGRPAASNESAPAEEPSDSPVSGTDYDTDIPF